MLPLSGRKVSDEGERGAVLVIVAMAMVAILLIVALVIDFGFVRNTRQSNKSDADVAVTAGLHGLESADGVPRPWGGVCAAATFAVANRSDGASLTRSYADGAGTGITGDPCTDPARLNQSCVPATTTPPTPAVLTTWARIRLTDAAGVEIDIRSGYVTPDPDFPEDAAAYAGDDGASIWGGCDQLAVIVTEGDGAYFGGIAGSGGYDTRIRSVGRVTIGSFTTEVVALLLLERTSCGSLVTSGNNTFVHVRATPVGAPTRPGLIHTNSNGTTDCSGSSRAMEGSSACSAITNCGTAGPSIVAGNVSAAVPGRIGVRAATTAPTSASTPSCPDPTAPTSGCTISPAPSDRGLVTRESVDARYLQRARDLKATASTETGRTSASATAAGYAVFADCNSLPVDGAGRTSSAVAGSARIFITGNCNAPSVLFDSTITDVVVRGSLSVGSGTTFEAPSVRRFFVGNGVAVQGTLRVNRGTSSTCTARTAAVHSAVTAFVVSSGAFVGGAQTILQMCSTFLFLADGALPTTNGTPPANNSSTGRINLGAQTSLDWTAPNQTSVAIPNTDPLYDEFEDLALWTEYSGNSSCSAGNGPGIGGQGAVTATGIFFLPNACPFNIAGGGSGAVINADAQFIVRRMRLSGTVALTMAPNPANAVPTPRFENFSLVR